MDNIGTLLLAIWFILTGLATFVKINFPRQSTVMGVLALLAGVFTLLGR